MKHRKPRIHHHAANKVRQWLAKKQPNSGEADKSPDSITAQPSGETPSPRPVDPPPQRGGAGNGATQRDGKQENPQPNPYEQQQLRLAGRMTWATYIIAGATVIYMMFSGYQSCMVRRSVEVSQEQVRVAQSQTNLSERIYNQSLLPQIIFVKGVFVGGLAIGKPVTTEIIFRNSGGVAENLSISSGYELRRIDNLSPLRCFNAPTIGEETASTMEPNTQIHGLRTLGFEMTPDRFKSLTDDPPSFRLVVYTVVKYQSGGRQYAKPFCNQYDKSVGFLMGECPSWWTCEKEK